MASPINTSQMNLDVESEITFLYTLTSDSRPTIHTHIYKPSIYTPNNSNHPPLPLTHPPNPINLIISYPYHQPILSDSP